MIITVDVLWNISVISAEGGKPKTLIKSQLNSKPENYVWPMGWTSDSKTIICYCPSSGLFGIPVSGGDWKEIFKFSDPKKAIVWTVLSPNGKLVASTSKESGNEDIYVIPVKGKKPVQITHHPTSDSGPKWSYDGRSLAFVSIRSGNREIWVIKIAPNGKPESEPIQVFQSLSPMNYTYNWTKNGKIGISVNPTRSNIFIADSGSNKKIRLTNIFSRDIRPRWSPDGTKIAFISDRGGKKNIWVVPSTGGEAMPIAGSITSKEGVVYIASPTWSPDGKKIAFTIPVRSNRGIWIVPAEGGMARKLELDYNGGTWEIDWSPDAKKIAFSSGGSKSAIFISPIDGGEPTRITKIDKVGLSFNSPRWSPDGKRLAFISKDPIKSEEGKKTEGIWTIDVQGREPKVLTKEMKGLYGGLSWSPDSENIIFSKYDKDKNQIYIVSSKGGAIRKLKMEGFWPDYSPDGSKIAFVKSLTKNEYWLIENFLHKLKDNK